MMTAELLRGFWYAHHNDLRRRPIQQTQKMEKYQSTIDKYKEDWKRALSMPGMCFLYLQYFHLFVRRCARSTDTSLYYSTLFTVYIAHILRT